ncbi:MAG: peptidylprolyl isomerase [Alphaproteobacteria bacterium]
MPMAAIGPVVANDVTRPDSCVAAEAKTQARATPQAEVREFLVREAGRLRIAAPLLTQTDGGRESDADALVRSLVESAVTIEEPDEAACRAAYDRAPDRYRSPDIVEAEQILLAASPSDKDAYEAAIEKARGLIATLVENRDRFGDLARALSACPSRANGGKLGQLQRGQTVPEFETFLFALDEGQLCPVPIRTRFGVHVLRVTCRADGRLLPFESVRLQVASELRAERWQGAVQKHVNRLVAATPMTGVMLPLVS